ncbi:hypothetical protein AC249_AIPGENE714 [Exaiptasia diaphana]|nr:hypothetical protein AC249_AIPGENE714 [Exaiptasia diaphana]
MSFELPPLYNNKYVEKNEPPTQPNVRRASQKAVHPKGCKGVQKAVFGNLNTCINRPRLNLLRHYLIFNALWDQFEEKTKEIRHVLSQTYPTMHCVYGT